MKDCLQNTNRKYHVFLSFRGEDTRLGFTDHLHSALLRKGIKPFRDDEELPRGAVVSKKLLRAIKESLSAIVIISKNYASSTWCLDELIKILQCKRFLGQKVFPIFYGVDPSDVRHQRGSFADAFMKHEEMFTKNKEKVQKWRNALREVANLSGWDSKNLHETQLIEEVVSQVWKNRELKLPTYNDGLVAIDTRLEELYSILNLETNDVRFIGIWGMGGIGKTTLATALFKKIRRQFDVGCFIADVREVTREGNQGLLRLQNKILSHLNIKGMVIETLSQGKDNMRNLLSNQKVLLILDDVSNEIQFENLAGNPEWFGRGSRIIVTTRNKHLLISHVVPFEMYESKVLNKVDSLQLFCEKAFKMDKPNEYYLELSKSVIDYSGGLPLALKVMGSFLCGRSLSEWEDALIKIKQVPHGDILSKLRISYDMLEDEHKTIFLDIACFFNGWYKHKVIQVMENCGLHPTVGINVLIEKSLLTFDGRIIGMHDLVEEMGKFIVFQESPSDPGRRSRLWSLEDIDQVLRKNKGTEFVQGIVLKSAPSMPYEAYWDPEAFSKMCNLRLLIVLCDLHLSYGLKSLSSSLKVLVWWGYPFSALPDGVQLDELVHLQMINSKFKQLGNGNQYFGKLKVIDLSDSKDLEQTPNVSGAPYLEEIYLNGCTKLVEVHESIRHHKKLKILTLIDCVNLRSFPSELEMCSLKELFLSGCSIAERLPDFGESVESLSVLNLMHCKSLLCLPNSICNLKSLKILNISGCPKIYCMPDSINQNKALEDLDLSETGITELGPSLLQLGNLKRLSARGCTHISLPHFLSSLSSLTDLDLSDCRLNDGSIPCDLDCLASLDRLNLNGNYSRLYYRDLEDGPLFISASLPPNLHMVGEKDPDERKVYLLDAEKIWKLFESSDPELFRPEVFRMGRSVDPDFFVYTEIPLRLINNQRFSPLSSPYVSEIDSIASITVDIPDDFHSIDWWGFAVLVALESQTSKKYFGGRLDAENFFVPFMDAVDMRLSWKFDPLEHGDGPSFSLFALTSVSSNLYMFTMIVSGDSIYTQRHLRANKLMGEVINIHPKPEFKKNSSLRFEVRVKGCKIKKCGWHMLRQEGNLEELQKVNSGELVETPFNAEHLGDLSKSAMDEFKQKEDVAALDVMHNEKFSVDEFKQKEDVPALDVMHNENFSSIDEFKQKDDVAALDVMHNENASSRKMFHNIRQGLRLILLALMSMMIGATIFPSPLLGLGFKQHTATKEASSKLLKSNWILHKTVAKIKTPQLRRNYKIYARQQLSFPIYQSPRKLIFSQSHYCSCLSR